jgi:uncharacterized protein with HEPN domain
VREHRERLRDILEAIERTEKYAARGKAAFDQDELVQVWILHHLQIIGEAARSLGPEILQALSEIPWSEIIGMRNILVHHYFEIDSEMVWSVVEKDLTPLKERVQAQLERVGPDMPNSPEHGGAD